MLRRGAGLYASARIGCLIRTDAVRQCKHPPALCSKVLPVDSRVDGESSVAYSAEFKRQVINRVRETGNFSEAARRFGLTTQTVSRWCSAERVSSDYADHSSHGVKRYRDQGCRCANCKSAFADGLFMVIAYVDQGMTLEEIGAEVDVSREWVRQVINQLSPGLTSRVVAERKNRRALENLTISKCGFCGTMFAEDKKTCSQRCYEQRELLRYHFSEKYRSSSRRAIARWRLKNEDYGTTDREHHVRVLADPDDVDSQGRWLVRGSKAHTAAVEAFRRGGSVFEELPAPIQDQVRTDAGSLAA